MSYLTLQIVGCSRHKQENASLPESPSIITRNGFVSQAELGIPIYPNANINKDQSYTFKNGSSSSSSAAKTTSISYTTPDSIDQVEIFYRNNLKSRAKITEHPSSGGKLVDILIEEPGRNIRAQIETLSHGKGSAIVVLTQSHLP